MALRSANHTVIRVVTLRTVILYTNWCGMHTLFFTEQGQGGPKAQV